MSERGLFDIRLWVDGDDLDEVRHRAWDFLAAVQRLADETPGVSARWVEPRSSRPPDSSGATLSRRELRGDR